MCCSTPKLTSSRTSGRARVHVYEAWRALCSCPAANACPRIACSNCRTTSGRCQGLAKAIFERYPKANCYHSVSKPGTVQLVEVSDGDRAKPLFICNLFGQIYAGLASGLRDSKHARLVLFKQCLRHLQSTLGTHAVLSSMRPLVVTFPARVRATTKTCYECSLLFVATPLRYLNDFHNPVCAFKIGCGIAGGEWAEYRRAICAFAHGQSDVEVHIVCIPGADASEKKFLHPTGSLNTASPKSRPTTKSIKPATSLAVVRDTAALRPSALELARARGVSLSPAENRPASEWIKRLEHVFFDRKV